MRCVCDHTKGPGVSGQRGAVQTLECLQARRALGPVHARVRVRLWGRRAAVWVVLCGWRLVGYWLWVGTPAVLGGGGSVCAC